MLLPLDLLIDAPPLQVLPLLERVLNHGDGRWQPRVEGNAVLWEPEAMAAGGAALPVRFRLAPALQAGQSQLTIACIEAEARSARLQAMVAGVVRGLRAHDLHVRPAAAPPRRVALLVTPTGGAYRALLPLLIQQLDRAGFESHHLPTELQPEQALDALQRGLATADLVVGEWDTLMARSALLQLWAQRRPALALARTRGAASGWPGKVVLYGQAQHAFWESLRQALAAVTGGEAGALWLPDEAEADAPATAASSAGADKRHIYREVARDPHASLEQRFHAARVLGEAGDPLGAAEVLGVLVQEAQEAALVQEALAMLGDLGAEARSVLWQLDAKTMPPRRAIEVARQLVRIGETQTGLFRLERLAQHEQEAIRLAALHALAEGGGPASPRFEALAEFARDPEVRLEAARWLQAQGEAVDLVRRTLVALTSHARRPDIAQAAVELLGKIGDAATRLELIRIAGQAPSLEARLSAAEVMMREGDTGAARAVLLTLAQGSDDIAAGAALDMLANVPGSAIQDTERLLSTAALRSVRRQAAELLSQPHQPESAQLAAARTFIALERPALARPVLARLVRGAAEVKLRRWAAQQLAMLGESALEALRLTFEVVDDPVVGQYLAEGILANSLVPDDRRQAAIWLADHSNLPRAVEVLGDLALSARVSGSDAVQATDDLARYAGRWAGAARTLAILASDSPHAAVRARALDLLLREYPSEIPLALLVDLAVTGSIGTGDRYPVMQQLNLLAQPVASRIVSRMDDADIDTDRRWQLLQLVGELPDNAATSALLQLSAGPLQNRIRYVAAEQLIARGQREAGFAALTSIAINEPDWLLRERALYELAQGLPDTKALFHSIIERTHYENTFHLARELLYLHAPSALVRFNRRLDHLLIWWERWVARLPLGWLDRLLGRRTTMDDRRPTTDDR